jgi:hypothetical protein
MARTKIFKRSSDSRLATTWKPILEGYGASVENTPWLAEYAHNHAIFDNTTPVFENTAPGVFFQTPGSLGGFMGNPSAPTNAMTPFTAGAKNSFSADANGSGDKFPSLLPVAIQVAAKTIGFDLVPVIPMDSPVGFLPYLDYLYAGGRTSGSNFDPYMVKLEGLTAASFAPAVLTPGDAVTGGATGEIIAEFVGYSRVDGTVIIKIVEDTQLTGDNTPAGEFVGAIIDIAANTAASAVTGVSLVSALENHISGFTSVSDADYANPGNFNGPYLPNTGNVPGSMRREAGENSKFRQMGLRMFTKFVEADTDQVAISATVEQIQDLNRVWNYDVISMLENVAVNDLAQSINKRLVDRVLQLADVHSAEVDLVEGAGITSLDLTIGGFDNTSTLQRRLVTKVLELANLIYHRGRFGAGTYMVTNGRIASALADVAGYSIAQVPTDMGGVAGNLYPAGKVYGVQVYVDPNMRWGDNRLAIGRKGADEEPGVKFMPYIMAESLQTISEGTFSPKIGMKSRYAITEAGWHPETQYISMDIDSRAIGVLTGSQAFATEPLEPLV